MTPPEPGIHEADEGAPPTPRQRYPSPPSAEQQRTYPSPPATSPARSDEPGPAAPAPAPPSAAPTWTAPPPAVQPAGPAVAGVALATTPPAAYRSPSLPATWVMVAAGVEVAASAVTVLAILLFTFVIPAGAPPADPGGAFGLTVTLFQPVASFVILVGTPGLLAFWACRCSRNLPVLGAAGQRWSPGWAACGWFVPLANLVIPFAVVRELWTASGGRGRSLVTAWGVAWAARIVLLPAARLVSPTNALTFLLGETILVTVPIVSAMLSIVLVYRLTAVQEARARLGIPAVGAAQPVWAQAYRSPKTRAGWSVVAIALAALAALAMLLDTVASLALFGAPVAGSTGVLILGWFVAAAAWLLAGVVAAPVAVAVWMHRAYGNLGLLGSGPVRWSPGWAAGAWFVPFANFVLPAVITGELWAASGPADGQPRTAMATWWAAWVGGLVLAAVSLPLHLAAADSGLQLLADTLGMLSDAGFILAGALAIAGVLAITRRQDARAAIAAFGAA